MEFPLLADDAVAPRLTNALHMGWHKPRPRMDAENRRIAADLAACDCCVLAA